MDKEDCGLNSRNIHQPRYGHFAIRNIDHGLKFNRVSPYQILCFVNKLFESYLRESFWCNSDNEDIFLGSQWRKNISDLGHIEAEIASAGQGTRMDDVTGFFGLKFLHVQSHHDIGCLILITAYFYKLHFSEDWYNDRTLTDLTCRSQTRAIVTKPFWNSLNCL